MFARAEKGRHEADDARVKPAAFSSLMNSAMINAPALWQVRFSLSKKSSESWAFSRTDDKIEEKRERGEKQMLNQQQELRRRVVEIL
ncbi:MAG: hypothetical protein IJ461_02160, partial [Clostridia bacterium]|nr:hypothetical protein [Clostridia bacterium]